MAIPSDNLKTNYLRMKQVLTIFLALIAVGFGYAQSHVNFIITDQMNSPLAGANVVIKGTTAGTASDATGLARLTGLPNGKTTFEISFIGYEKKQVTLNFPSDSGRTIKIELEEGEELEEIVIASTRSSRTIEDTPTRIEAITGEELGEKAAMNSSNIGMLLSETTGVQMQQTSLSSGNLSIRIQGLDGRYTQILKDGFPLYSGFAGGLSIMQIPPLDLQQVELIKGSNSTLYGGGAIAGLVNLISIAPGSKPQLNIMFNQTSASGTTGNAFYAQKFGKAGLTLYGSASNQKAFDPDNDGFSNLPKSQTINFNPRFFYYPAPHTELNFGLSANLDQRTGGDMQVINQQSDADHLFSEKNVSERYSTQLMLRTTRENHAFSLKNSISWFNRNLEIPDYQFKGNQISSFSEFLFSLKKSKKSDWQFGANHYYEKFNDKHSAADPDRSYEQNTVGVFAQNTTDFHPKLTLESGLRSDYNPDYGTFWLPRLSLLYKPVSRLTARIGGAMGYKLPTIFTEESERRYYQHILPLPASDIKPETSVGGSFDLNYKTVFFDELSFSINQLFFATRLKNSLLLEENTPTGAFEFKNAAGNVVSSGFETNIKLTWNDFKL